MGTLHLINLINTMKSNPINVNRLIKLSYSTEDNIDSHLQGNNVNAGCVINPSQQNQALKYI